MLMRFGKWMTIGDSDLFAIHYYIYCKTEKYCFVRLYCSCGGIKIGESECNDILWVLSSSLKGKMEEYDKDKALLFENMTKEEIYQRVIVRHDNDDEMTPDEALLLENLMILTNSAPAFDGDEFVLISTFKHDRIIFKPFNTNALHEVVLPSGYVFEVMKKYCDSAEKTDNSPLLFPGVVCD